MKQVILKKKPVDVVAVEDISSEKYYGIEESEGYKGFIAAKNYLGKPLVLAADSVTQGNGWSALDNKTTLKSCIITAINEGCQVYEFNTNKELFAWLAQD